MMMTMMMMIKFIKLLFPYGDNNVPAYMREIERKLGRWKGRKRKSFERKMSTSFSLCVAAAVSCTPLSICSFKCNSYHVDGKPEKI